MLDAYTKDRLAECQTETERINVLAFLRIEQKAERRLTTSPAAEPHDASASTTAALADAGSTAVPPASSSP